MTQVQATSTLPALLRRMASERGDHPALVMRAQQLSYTELEQRTAQLARALLASGAGKGTRIALMAPDGILWVTTFLASLRIGALLTTVSTLCAPAELEHILRNSDIQILIGARRFLRNDYAQTLEAALPGLAEGKHGELQLAAAPYLRAVWLDGADGLDWARPVDELLALAAAPGSPDDTLLAAVEREVSPGDDAVIIYTSGSTSLPKAVVHSQGNICRQSAEMAKLFLLKPGDRMMPLLPAFWLGGMVKILEVLNVGATLVYPDSPETDVVLDTIGEFKVNRLNSWGDLLVKLREAATARGIDVDAIVGLGPFRDQDGELIPDELQSNMLGMSETFAVHSGEALDVRLPQSRAGASGRAVGGYERRVVDPQTHEDVAPGEVGELLVRGGALMSGFYKVPREETFTADGFYPTGDLVRIDADGYLYFIARRGDMIKTRSANVSRLEVEAALAALPEVSACAVVGLDDARLGQRVVAAVVPAAGANPTEDSVRDGLRDKLSSYKLPRDIVFVGDDELPRTASGKIRLDKAAELIASRITRSHQAT